MNWLDPPAEPPNVEPELDPSAPSRHNLNYWAARLTPLHDPTPGYSSVPATPKEAKEVVFVSCNRVGTEEGESANTLREWSADETRLKVRGHELGHDDLVEPESHRVSGVLQYVGGEGHAGDRIMMRGRRGS